MPLALRCRESQNHSLIPDTSPTRRGEVIAPKEGSGCGLIWAYSSPLTPERAGVGASLEGRLPTPIGCEKDKCLVEPAAGPSRRSTASQDINPAA